MAAVVRVLGAKGRIEGVNFGQREAIGLDVELARDRRERFAAKKNPARNRPWSSAQIKIMCRSTPTVAEAWFSSMLP
jgi:hypothetical protein